MIHRGRAQLDGEAHALALCQLIGVHAQPKALGLGRLEDSTRLIDVEGSALDEHIGPGRMRRAGLQHRPAHEIDVVVRTLGVLGGHDMCTQKGRLIGDRPRGDERAPLVVDGESVAGLRLESGRALSQGLGCQARSIRGKLGVAGRARGRDRRANSPGGVRRP